jgi:gliding motility-associated-like protein
MKKFLTVLTLLCPLPFLLYAQTGKEEIKRSLRENQMRTRQPLDFSSFQPLNGGTACDARSFQLALNSSQTEHPSDIVQLPTTSYIICGNSTTSSGTNGRLIKLAPDGHILLSKELSLSGQQLELKRLCYLSTGYLYAIGTSTDIVTGATAPVLINIDTSSLTLLSVAQLQISEGPSNWKGFDLCQGPDHTFFLLCNNDSLINVSRRIERSNDAVFSHTYRPRHAPKMVGIEAESPYVHVAWNEVDSGYTKGVVVTLHLVSGQVMFATRVGGAAEGVNIELQGMCLVNSRPRFTALQYNSTRSELIRINYDTIPAFREFFSIAGFTPAPGMLSRQNAWGESLALQTQPGSSELTIVQAFPDNYFDDPIRGWKLSFPSAIDLKRQLMCYDGGNITLAGYSGGIMVCKMDSVPSACNTIPVNASSHIQYEVPYGRDTLARLLPGFRYVAGSISETDLALSKTVYCQSFDAGPDRTKCNKDTLHLDAPPGFSNYSWSNNYAISSTTSQHVIVNPIIDTAYYVKAEKSPGCFAYDTVRVYVNTSPPINLGIDKSFCQGDSAVFNAGSGFDQYIWSNGSRQQQVTVKTSGTFWVIGSTAQGCKSYDTVKVSKVFSNPAVTVDHNPALCTGSSRILDAGKFSSYLWNDGSVTEKFTIKNIGIYAVEVTDNNGCKGTDTATVTTLLPLPSDFLPADTLLCSYDKLVIASQRSYSFYQWSSGASGSSITIGQPGTYWLLVKDANGCMGKDSITINPKDCMKGFYIPTAFTPNHDGNNDLFRPLLFGNVKKYQFTVYNRWGQIVFQTTDLGKAWDGTYESLLQQSNAFVWICTYQFEEEEVKTQRGTVMLVR